MTSSQNGIAFILTCRMYIIIFEIFSCSLALNEKIYTKYIFDIPSISGRLKLSCSKMSRGRNTLKSTKRWAFVLENKSNRTPRQIFNAIIVVVSFIPFSPLFNFQEQLMRIFVHEKNGKMTSLCVVSNSMNIFHNSWLAWLTYDLNFLVSKV